MESIQPAPSSFRTWSLGFVGTLGRGIAIGAVVGWLWAILVVVILVLVESFDHVEVMIAISDSAGILTVISLLVGAVVGAFIALALWAAFSVLPQKWLRNHRLAGGLVGLVAATAISARSFTLLYAMPPIPNPLSQDVVIVLGLVFVIPCFLGAIVAAVFAHRYYTVPQVFNPWPQNQSARTE